MSEWIATLLLLLINQLASSTGLENLESEGPIVGHWIHVQKCCPEAHMMVEVASKTTATTHSTGSKFECQLQNDTSFRWAPDFLDNQNNLLSFEGRLDKDSADSDFNITKFCIPNGPCISSIVGKPQCGPVKYKCITSNKILALTRVFHILKLVSSLAHLYIRRISRRFTITTFWCSTSCGGQVSRGSSSPRIST